MRGIPPSLLMRACVLLKNRQIQKKDFTKAVQEGYDVWKVAQDTEKAIRDTLSGFEPATKKICDCEYWRGIEVEVVKTEWKNDAHVVHVLHQGTVYKYFKPEWLKDSK